MKKWTVAFIIFLLLALAHSNRANAQCSICTKTAQQMGEKPATGLNAGIMYLAAMPFLIFGYISYRWLKANR
jgi:hypothetical protein